MHLLRKTILPFISCLLLIACSAKIDKESESTEKEASIINLIHIGDSIQKVQKEIIVLGFKGNNGFLKKSDSELEISVLLSGNEIVESFKIEWKGDLKPLFKRLKNEIDQKYTDLKESNGYYSCRIQEGNAEVIVEFIVWENKIELSHRKSH